MQEYPCPYCRAPEYLEEQAQEKIQAAAEQRCLESMIRAAHPDRTDFYYGDDDDSY